LTNRLLLISTSTVHGTGYLDHAEDEIRSILGVTARVLFVPYALKDLDGYAARARARFEAMGFALDSIHEAPSPRAAVEAAAAVFVGGGNTFRLLSVLRRLGVMDALRQRAAHGMAYLGASAGSNLACPTIRTTNDMPIVEPPSLEALGLVPFQINPHYIDPDPASTHMGETREERLLQFLEENETPVVGLREGAMLRVDGESVLLKGIAGARIFRRGRDPVEAEPGADIGALLAETTHP
jgi:dipeptidase E